MAEREEFLAIGEETGRGTAEKTTLGYFPVEGFSLPAPDFHERKRDEFRGDDTALGATTALRMGQSWDGLDLNIPFFSEAGSTAGMAGTILRHFFGKVSSAQNGATGQYAHMLYPVSDMFGTANLGATAITFNMNAKHGTVLKNHPYNGGRVKTLKFNQEVNRPLIVTVGGMGQKLDTPETGLASPVFPAENLRFDYNNMVVKAGATVTRTGTAPNFTDITSTGNQVKPDSLTLELERGMVDKFVLDGSDTVGKTNIGVFTGKLSMVIDFEDPASGFKSVAEFTAWLAAVSSTNFVITWDTGTVAGSGDNHSLILDLPVCNRLGGMPEFNLTDDPKITLEYEVLFDSATALYAVGLLLKNTAASV